MSGLQVKFLKGCDELKLRSPYELQEEEAVGFFRGYHQGAPLSWMAPDGSAYLQVGNSRFCFYRGNVHGNFASEKDRQKYMDKINKAVGEVICVPAELLEGVVP